MAVYGNLNVKSCAGDLDINLQILGLDADGCKNLTELDSKKYAKWISDSIFQGSHSLVPNFTRVCRCSWDGCNGLSTLELLQKREQFVQNHATVGGEIMLAQISYTSTPYQLIIFTTIVRLFVDFV